MVSLPAQIRVWHCPHTMNLIMEGFSNMAVKIIEIETADLFNTLMDIRAYLVNSTVKTSNLVPSSATSFVQIVFDRTKTMLSSSLLKPLGTKSETHRSFWLRNQKHCGFYSREELREHNLCRGNKQTTKQTAWQTILRGANLGRLTVSKTRTRNPKMTEITDTKM